MTIIKSMMAMFVNILDTENENRAWLVPSLMILVVFLGFISCKKIARGSSLSSEKLSALTGLPVAENSASSLSEALLKARNQFPDTPFILPGAPNRVILPSSALAETKGLSQDVFSFSGYLHEYLLGNYTGVSEIPLEVKSAVKIDLTRNVADILHDLQDETDHIMEHDIGPCVQWKQIPVYETALRTVSLLSGRIFVGLPLSREVAWADTMVNFATDFVAFVHRLKSYHFLVRPFVVLFIPELRRVIQYRSFVGRRLWQSFGEIRKHRKASKLLPEHTSDDSQFNMMNWIVNYVKDVQAIKPTILADFQLGLSFAAIHTTGMALSQALLDLAAHPECVAELRREIEDARAALGYEDGRFRKSDLPRLRKLDSFLRESQRHNPADMFPINRKVMVKEGITLSSGQHLPHNTCVAFAHPHYPGVPIVAMNSEKSSKAVGRYIDTAPLEFDPFRYTKIRQQEGEEARHQFAAVNQDNMAFGAGSTACPGRFFASYELKITLIALLDRFDVRLLPSMTTAVDKNGYAIPRRPATVEHGIDYTVDLEAKVWLKARE